MDGTFEPASSEHAMRMGHALVVNVLVLVSAWRFVRGMGVGDSIQRVLDAVLLWLGVQYACAMLCGAAGVMNAWTMTVAAVVACGTMWVTAGRRRVGEASLFIEGAEQSRTKAVLSYIPPHLDRPRFAWERYVAWACVGFLVGYGGAVLGNQYYIAVMSDDALTYHVPSAVRWLQTGRLVLHETWFFNPANTYSPLAGSSFIAWWFAPLGNDWVARFVQVPGLALVFVATIRLGRLLGAPLSVAVLVALAAGLSRPFMRQILVTKDDLYLAGFFIAAVVALARENIVERVGPWRVGVAVGLFLATKYTALLALPMLLLMVDAPVRAKWGWKQWAVAVGVTAVLAGPWFLRNWWMTGNPLFPIDVSVAGLRVFDGMFSTRRSEELTTLAGVWRILTDTHFSMLPLLFVTLLITWGGAVVVAARRMVHEPLVRVCVVGPVVGIGAFVLTSPYSEVRFVDPAFLLMFGSVALALASLPLAAGVAFATVLVGLSLYTGFFVNRWTFIGGGTLVAILVGTAAVLQDRVLRLGARGSVMIAGACAMVVVAYLYVYQDPEVRQYERLTHAVWSSQYGRIADGWEFVRRQVPAESVVAYTNSQFVYPLMGFAGDRHLTYAPTRTGVAPLHALPRIGERIPGERLAQEISRVTVAEANRDVWLENLRRTGAAYLFISKAGVVKEPPELAFARAEPGRFQVVFENEAAVVYRIVWEGN